MKRVGRSVVSAITQTPASGPLGLVTTPPRSLSPMLTAAGAGACALTCAGGAPRSATIAIAATLKDRPVLMVMTAPPVSFSATPVGSRPGGSPISMHKRLPSATTQRTHQHTRDTNRALRDCRVKQDAYPCAARDTSLRLPRLHTFRLDFVEEI